LGSGAADFLSRADQQGTRRLLGETISHTGFIIAVLQVAVSRGIEKFKPVPAFLSGLTVGAVGFFFPGYARTGAPAWVFLGIFLFALGEMISSPRIQEYITWIAPKEKAGLYMGTNFLALGIGGALSGVTYTSLYGYFQKIGHPEYAWFSLAAHFLLGMLAITLFTKIWGEFKEMEE
jgi:POT family proton-dependent oligopeptide transporter